MAVAQFTTPVFTLTFEEPTLDLTIASNVYVTFRSGNYVLTKKGDALVIEEKSIGVHLTQKETANFVPGFIEIQANWTLSGGDRVASNIVRYNIDGQLLMAVIE